MITKKYLESLSYTDFVAFINQTNVLPGAYDTLNRWIKYSNITSNSFILDVACTTGFKSREISYLTNCKGEAFDISKFAIESAKKNQIKILNKENINYFQQNGYKYTTNKKFTHIILGAGLGFFSDPKKMLDICIDLLEEDGFILASPYYIKKEIPEEIMNKFKEILDIYPTNKFYKGIMNIYLNSGLEILYEERKDIIPETEEEIKFYVDSTIKHLYTNSQFDKEALNFANNRLYEIKKYVMN